MNADTYLRTQDKSVSQIDTDPFFGEGGGTYVLAEEVDNTLSISTINV